MRTYITVQNVNSGSVGRTSLAPGRPMSYRPLPEANRFYADTEYDIRLDVFPMASVESVLTHHTEDEPAERLHAAWLSNLVALVGLIETPPRANTST